MAWLPYVGPHAGIVNTKQLVAVQVVYKKAGLYHVNGYSANSDCYTLATADNASDAEQILWGFRDHEMYGD
jgi:hypothetical protein